MTTPKLTKKQLRQQMKRMLNALTDLEKNLESHRTIKKINQFISASPHIKTIASYAAMPSELNLNSLHSNLTDIHFCYPKCGDNGQMEFHIVENLSDMKPSAYGIPEPNVLLHQQLDPEEIDLFLCPAYAFTRDGKRLGKGGGYYDRYLLKKRPDAITLGIAFPCQIINQLPTDEHDLLVDRIL